MLLRFLVIFLVVLTTASRAETPPWTEIEPRTGDDVFTGEQAFRQLRTTIHSITPKRSGKYAERKVSVRFEPNRFEIRDLIYPVPGIGLILPIRTEDWLNDPARLTAVTKCLILARFGRPATEEKTIPDNWILSAIMRKTKATLSSASIRGRCSGAYAMASRGMIPPLKSILQHPLRPSDGAAVYALQEEWAQVLLDLCIRSGGVRTGALGFFLEEMLRSQSNKDPVLLFENALYAKLDSIHRTELRIRRKEVGNPPGIPSSVWFRKGAEAILLNRFSPMAPTALEQAYRKALSEAAEKDILSVEDLYAGIQEEPELRKHLPALIQRLHELLYMAPPEVTDSFALLIRALNEPSAGKGNLRQLKKYETAFLDTLGIRTAWDRILRTAEHRHYPPGTRAGQSLSGISMAETSYYADRVLDRYLRTKETAP